MLMLLQLGKASSTDSLAPWVWAGIFASFAILDRYAGMTVVMTGTILLAGTKTKSITDLVRRLFIFLSIAMLPACLWFYRNYAISSTLTGYRAESARTFLQSSYDLLNVLSLWFLPSWLPFRYRAYLIIFLVILFLFLLFVVGRRHVHVIDIAAIRPFLFFTFLYTVFMIYTTSTTALSPIDDRYMSPIFAPLILSLFYLLDRLTYQYGLNTENSVPRAVIAISLLIWLMYPVVTTYRAVKAYRK